MHNQLAILKENSARHLTPLSQVAAVTVTGVIIIGSRESRSWLISIALSRLIKEDRCGSKSFTFPVEHTSLYEYTKTDLSIRLSVFSLGGFGAIKTKLSNIMPSGRRLSRIMT